MQRISWNSEYRPIPPHHPPRKCTIFSKRFLAVVIFIFFNYCWFSYYSLLDFSAVYDPTDERSHYGYIPTPRGEIFFWLFQSRNDPSNDPLLIWLQGGPGCSSELALFTENGPFLLRDNELVRNAYSWNSRATVLYVDQPVGTGFSYAQASDCDTTECAASDFHDFLSNFFSRYPDYKDLPLFLSGESYGGHYVPSFAHKIHTVGEFSLNGIIVGNGLVNSEVQFESYFEFGIRRNMIKDIEKTESMQLKCDVKAWLGESECGHLMEVILDNGRLCPFDVTQTEKEFEQSWADLTSFVNGLGLQRATGVSKQWNVCNETVLIEFGMKRDPFRKYDSVVADLLNAEVPVLIFAGRDDLSCNFVGQRMWIEQMKWKGQGRFNTKTMRDWKDGKGLIKREGDLTYIEILNAGHMVPQRQPALALQMVNEFISS